MNPTSSKVLKKLRRKSLSVTLIFLLTSALACAVASTPVTTPAAPRIVSGTISIGDLQITHTYVSGFLFASGDTKILIDSLHKWEMPVALQGAMLKPLPPFDGVDVVLASHIHGDHFDPYLVGKHLENNPGAVFVSVSEAEVELKNNFANFDAVKDRVRTVRVEKGETATLTVNGIDLKILGMNHGFYEMFYGRNYGYLFTLGGVKVLHMGDSLLTPSEMQAFNLPQEEVDIVLVPWWYILTSDAEKALREGVQAKQVIVMHNENLNMGEKTYEWEWVLQRIGTAFPDAIVFYELTEEEPSAEPSEETPAAETPEPTRDMCLGTSLLSALLAAGAYVMRKRRSSTP